MTTTLPDRAHTSMNAADMAEKLWNDPRWRGFRIEAYGGRVVLNPPPDGGHAVALSEIMKLAFATYDDRLELPGVTLVQGLALALPGGNGEYVIPDLSIVDADFRKHQRPNNLYPGHVFRAVIEITSGNWIDDVEAKPGLYAEAGVPAYVIGDRMHGVVRVLSRPEEGEYLNVATCKPGETFTLPGDLPAEIPVDLVLRD